ncbi:MAG: hypothetical protein U9Q81_22285 [Pseudomonadota bacterium]|nr:hypothetical protein [Pseudomonadota bacterium]
MNDPRPPGVGEDAAWVIVSTRLPPSEIRALLEDPERLLRVNSQWVFEAWSRPTADRFRLRIQNQSNARTWDTAGTIRPLPDGLRLDYDEGIKASTRFLVELAAEGARLWVVEEYGRLSEEERRARSDEVDRSLPRWGQDLYRYLRSWGRWSRLAPWRWYMERVWRPMKPLARRIVRLLIWATVAEILLFLGLIAVLRTDLGV